MFTAFTVISIVSAAVAILGAVARTGATVSVINSLEDVVDFSATEAYTSGIDQAYVDISKQAIEMLAHFIQYARLLVMVCALLALIFYCFKLWFSTIELKKFYAESILKIMVVTVMMTVYPTVVVKVFNVATELGVEASGGEDTLKVAYGSVAQNCYNVWDKCADQIFMQLQQGTATQGGRIVVSKTVLEDFNFLGLSDDQATAWLNNHGITVDDKKNMSKSERKNSKNYGNSVELTKEEQKLMAQSVEILTHMGELLTGVSADDIENPEKGTDFVTEVLTKGRSALDNVYYDPYIKNTKQLSTSSMLKTAIFISECLSAGALSPLNVSKSEDNSDKQSVVDLVKDKKPRLVLKIVLIVCRVFIYKLLLVIAVLYGMIEYILALVEYLIVAAISALLIPLFFIDSTKQYAMNILKTILSFGIKIMVTTMMIFFAIGMWIKMGMRCINLDLNSTITLVYYVFNVMLGIIMIKASGKIAGAVLTGNPSLGIGDVANQIRTMGHMAHSAQHAAQNLGRSYQKAAQAVSNAGGEVARFHSAKQAAREAANDAKVSTQERLRAMGESGQLSGAGGKAWSEMSESQQNDFLNKAGKEAYRNTMASSMGEYSKDQAFKKLTGMDRPMFGKKGNGRLVIGQEFVDQDGHLKRATFEDVQNRNRELAKLAGDQTVEEFLKAMNKEGQSNQRRQDRDYDDPTAYNHNGNMPETNGY